MKQMSNIDKVEFVRGILIHIEKELAELRTSLVLQHLEDSPAKDKPSDKSYFDHVLEKEESFQCCDGSGKIEEPYMMDSAKYNEILEKEYEYGKKLRETSPFGRTVCGDKPKEVYEDTDRRRLIQCPHCSGKLTD